MVRSLGSEYGLSPKRCFVSSAGDVFYSHIFIFFASLCSTPTEAESSVQVGGVRDRKRSSTPLCFRGIVHQPGLRSSRQADADCSVRSLHSDSQSGAAFKVDQTPVFSLHRPNHRLHEEHPLSKPVFGGCHHPVPFRSCPGARHALPPLFRGYASDGISERCTSLDCLHIYGRQLHRQILNGSDHKR